MRMARRLLPLSTWRPHAWRDTTSRLIDDRIAHHRHEIASALALDDKSEIDAVFEELRTLFFRCLSFLRDVDGAASVARQRISLAAFRKTGQYTAEAFWKLDPATQNRIATHYRGRIDLTGNRISNRLLRIGVERAIDELGPPRRGRPSKTDSLALRQFALGLADIYHRHTGKMPARRRNDYRALEYGPFRDFVSVILGLLPRRLRSIKSAGRHAPDYLVRLAITELREGRKSGDARRTYLIDEALWHAP